MKIAPRASADFLKKPDAAHHALLIYGPDEGQVRLRARQALTALLPNGQDAFNTEEITETRLKEDEAALHDAVASLSLLGGKRVVLLRHAPDKLANAVEKAVATPGNYLIVTAGELGPRAALRVLFETRPTLASLPCYKDEPGDVATQIRQFFERAQIRLEPGVLDIFASRLGEDRGVTQAELEKAALYAGEQRLLTQEDARTLIAQQREADMDALAMAMAEGNAAMLDAQLNLAWREGAQPVAVLRGVQRHFQRLYQARADVEEGKTADAAVAQLKPPVFFKHAPRVTQQVSRWQRRSLARALTMLTQTEAECKSSSVHPTGAVSLCLQRIASLGRR